MLRRKCELCGKMYEPRVRWQKYCSKHCGDKVRLARHRARASQQPKQPEPDLVPILKESIAVASAARAKQPWRPGA